MLNLDNCLLIFDCKALLTHSMALVAGIKEDVRAEDVLSLLDLSFSVINILRSVSFLDKMFDDFSFGHLFSLL